jgi:hypothetical protein
MKNLVYNSFFFVHREKDEKPKQLLPAMHELKIACINALRPQSRESPCPFQKMLMLVLESDLMFRIQLSEYLVLT